MAANGKTDNPKDETKKPEEPKEERIQTKHSVVIDGVTIAYTATAGTLLLKSEEGDAKASIFYIAYTRDDVKDTASRPITFSFNGGPGSSSVWMHLGMLGPRIVQMGENGRIDSRFTGADRDAAGEMFEYDPSISATQGLYTATLNDYLRRELRFESDLPYEILTGLYLKWDYSKHQNQFLNVAETLRKTMSQNPYLKIFVANGYYDLATPYFATEYTFNHLEIEPSLQQNITMAWYEAGHMMYVHPPSLVQIKADMAAFIAGATDTDAKEPLGVLPVW